MARKLAVTQSHQGWARETILYENSEGSLKGKEQGPMVGNLHLGVKIDLEGKQRRHSCQEPGLLGSAGEGLARAPGQEARDTSPLGFRDPLSSGWEGVCMVMGALCSVSLPPTSKEDKLSNSLTRHSKDNS